MSRWSTTRSGYLLWPSDAKSCALFPAPHALSPLPTPHLKGLGDFLGVILQRGRADVADKIDRQTDHARHAAILAERRQPRVLGKRALLAGLGERRGAPDVGKVDMKVMLQPVRQHHPRPLANLAAEGVVAVGVALVVLAQALHNVPGVRLERVSVAGKQPLEQISGLWEGAGM